MLDNCYGEFVEKVTPMSVGVDIMAGSLIKNAGGGIAPTGGYIAGKKNLSRCAHTDLQLRVRVRKSVQRSATTVNSLWGLITLRLCLARH